jgi:hypothetical protein
MKPRGRALGSPLPPVRDFPAPTEQEQDRAEASWNSLVPEWAGLTNPQPPGTEGAKFYRDEITGVITRARDGHVVTDADRRAAMDAYTKAVRG